MLSTNSINDPISQFIVKAQEFLKQEKYDAVIKCYTQVIKMAEEKKDRRLAQAYFQRGLAYKELKKVNLAEIDIGNAYFYDKNEDKEIQEERSYFFSVRRSMYVAQAIKNHLQKLQKIAGENPTQYQIELAKIEIFGKAMGLRCDADDDYLHERKSQLALENIQKSIDLFPTPAAYLIKGKLLHRLEKYTEAILEYKEASKLENDPLSYFCIGLAAVKMADYETARLNFLIAMKLDSKGTRFSKNEQGTILKDWENLETFYQKSLNKKFDELKNTSTLTDEDQRFCVDIDVINTFICDNKKTDNLLDPYFYYDRSKTFVKLKEFDNAEKDLTFAIWLIVTKNSFKKSVALSQLYIARRNVHVELLKLREASVDSVDAILSAKDLNIKEIFELEWINKAFLLKDGVNKSIPENVTNMANIQLVVKLLEKAEKVYKQRNLKDAFILLCDAISILTSCFIPKDKYIKANKNLSGLVSGESKRIEFLLEAEKAPQSNILHKKIISLRKLVFQACKKNEEIQFPGFSELENKNPEVETKEKEMKEKEIKVTESTEFATNKVPDSVSTPSQGNSELKNKNPELETKELEVEEKETKVTEIADTIDNNISESASTPIQSGSEFEHKNPEVEAKEIEVKEKEIKLTESAETTDNNASESVSTTNDNKRIIRRVKLSSEELKKIDEQKEKDHADKVAKEQTEKEERDKGVRRQRYAEKKEKRKKQKQSIDINGSKDHHRSHVKRMSVENANSFENADSSESVNSSVNPDFSKGVSSSEKLYSSKSANFAENLDSSKNLNSAEKLESSKSINSTENLESFKIVNSAENLTSSKNVNFSENLDSSKSINISKTVKPTQKSNSFKNINPLLESGSTKSIDPTPKFDLLESNAELISKKRWAIFSELFKSQNSVKNLSNINPQSIVSSHHDLTTVSSQSTTPSKSHDQTTELQHFKEVPVINNLPITKIEEASVSNKETKSESSSPNLQPLLPSPGMAAENNEIKTEELPQVSKEETKTADLEATNNPQAISTFSENKQEEKIELPTNILHPMLPIPSTKIKISPFISECIKQIQLHSGDKDSLTFVYGDYVRCSLPAGIKSVEGIKIGTGASESAIEAAFSKIATIKKQAKPTGDVFTIKFHPNVNYFNGISFINGKEFFNGIKCDYGVTFNSGIKIQVVRNNYLCNENLTPLDYLLTLVAFVKSLGFTMNAAISDHGGNVWALLPNILEDIQNKFIRTTYPAYLACIDDPLLMLQGLYLKETLKFNLDNELSKTINDCSSLLNKLFPQDINSLMYKIVKSGNSAEIFQQLLRYGLINRLFPEMANNFSEKLYCDWLNEQLLSVDTQLFYDRDLNYVYMMMIMGTLNKDTMKKYDPDNITSCSSIVSEIVNIINSNPLLKTNFSTYSLQRRNELIDDIAPKLCAFLNKNIGSLLNSTQNGINPHALWPTVNPNAAALIAAQNSDQAGNIINQSLNHNQQNKN